MLLVCPTCEASYQIDDGKIGPSGRTVRCKKCATVWFANLASAAPEPEPVPEAVAEDPAMSADADSSGWGDSASEPVNHPEPATAPSGEPPAFPAEIGPESASDNADSQVIDQTPPRNGSTGKKGRASKSSGKSSFKLPSFSGISPGKTAPYAAFGLCLMLVTAVAVREPLARSMPGMESFFSAIGLPVAKTPVTIAQVRSELSKLDKADVLLVEGELVNKSSHAVTIPPVQIAVRDAAGTEIYVWSADVLKPTLQGGESSPFRARLASPPANGRSVAVRFGQAPADSPDKAPPKKS